MIKKPQLFYWLSQTISSNISNRVSFAWPNTLLLIRAVHERADIFSRFVHKHDWSLNPVVFQDIDVKKGSHTLDLAKFNSKFVSPGR